MRPMAADDVNPYESPQTVSRDPARDTRSGLVRTTIRVAVMGSIGYAAFAACGLLYFALAEYFQLEIFPSIPWALEVGGIGAAIFLGSEVFNSGAGKNAGFLGRILVSVAVFVVSLFVSAILESWLGWNPRTYEDDPSWLRSLVLGLAVFCSGIVLARVLWIGLEPRRPSAS